MSKAKQDRESFLTWFEKEWKVFEKEVLACKSRAQLVAANRKYKTVLTLGRTNYPKFIPYINSGIEMLEAKIGILTADQPAETKRVAQGKPKIKIKLPRWMRRKKDGGNSFPA